MLSPFTLSLLAATTVYFGLMMAAFAPRDAVPTRRHDSWLVRQRAAWRTSPILSTIGLVLLPIGTLYLLATAVLDRDPFWPAYLAALATFSAVMWLTADAVDGGTDAVANWRSDPDRCGACGYGWTADNRDDETGRRRCPECGWREPPVDVKVEPPDWWIPWRHPWYPPLIYDPPHARGQWLRALLSQVVFFALIIGLALAFRGRREFFAFAGFPLSMGVWAILNVYRIERFRRHAAGGGVG